MRPAGHHVADWADGGAGAAAGEHPATDPAVAAGSAGSDCPELCATVVSVVARPPTAVAATGAGRLASAVQVGGPALGDPELGLPALGPPEEPAGPVATGPYAGSAGVAATTLESLPPVSDVVPKAEGRLADESAAPAVAGPPAGAAPPVDAAAGATAVASATAGAEVAARWCSVPLAPPRTRSSTTHPPMMA